MTASRNPDDRIDAFLGEGLTDLPDHAFDAVRSDIHRTRQRVVVGPWREPNVSTFTKLAVAAALLVAVGFAWVRFGPVSSIGTPTSPPVSAPVVTLGPSAVPAAQALGTEAQALTPGRYKIDYGSVPGASGTGPTIVFDVPASGWWSAGNNSVEVIYPDGISYGPAFTVWNITDLPADPCTDHRPAATQPEGGYRDLLDAIRRQKGINGGTPTAITIDGYPGMFLDFQVATDIDTCDAGDFLTWGTEGNGREAKGNLESDRVYALEVEGQRITFFTRTLPDSMGEHESQLNRIVRSIQIEP